MTLNGKQLNKRALLSISWNKAHTAHSGVNIHLQTRRFGYPSHQKCLKVTTFFLNDFFTQTPNSSDLYRTRRSLSSLCSHQTRLHPHLHGRIIHQRRLFLRPLIRFAGRPAAWESILTARRAARLKMTSCIAHTPPLPPIHPPHRHLPPQARCSHTVCVCALVGLPPPCVGITHLFQRTLDVLSPRYLHYSNIWVTRGWVGRWVGTKYESFIVLAAFIKME